MLRRFTSFRGPSQRVRPSAGPMTGSSRESGIHASRFALSCAPQHEGPRPEERAWFEARPHPEERAKRASRRTQHSRMTFMDEASDRSMQPEISCQHVRKVFGKGSAAFEAVTAATFAIEKG